ncbi:MAG: CDP-diacylglycerol--serine O-phosphatidyltransferase [Bacteriovoracia bacterium]
MKKIYILPNLFTTANMGCGFLGMAFATQGKFLEAAYTLIAAMFFDAMDGRIARLARATSAFGVQYDSLSDLLSFGVSPAFIVYLWCLQPLGRLGLLISFLYLTCTALRLARFNVLSQTVPKKYFQGLPSPLAAATVVTGLIFYIETSMTFRKDWFMFVILLITSSLMISNVAFYSFKEFKIRKENSFQVLALGILFFILISVKHEVTLFFICVFYIGATLILRTSQALVGKSVSSVPKNGSDSSQPESPGH